MEADLDRTYQQDRRHANPDRDGQVMQPRMAGTRRGDIGKRCRIDFAWLPPTRNSMLMERLRPRRAIIDCPAFGVDQHIIRLLQCHEGGRIARHRHVGMNETRLAAVGGGDRLRIGRRWDTEPRVMAFGIQGPSRWRHGGGAILLLVATLSPATRFHAVAPELRAAQNVAPGGFFGMIYPLFIFS